MEKVSRLRFPGVTFSANLKSTEHAAMVTAESGEDSAEDCQQIYNTQCLRKTKHMVEANIKHGFELPADVSLHPSACCLCYIIG